MAAEWRETCDCDMAAAPLQLRCSACYRPAGPPRPAVALQVCGVQFSQYRLLPMGSQSRVSDARGTYDLHGPANKFVCISFDKAQVGFLTCLKVGGRAGGQAPG